MRGATLFSGIGCAEVAGPGIDWRWCAEVDPFASAVLAARFPDTPNLGDVTAPDFIERAAGYGAIDVLIFGSPCQSFSIAGKRGGLDDDRGNLALVALRIARSLRPKWMVFENVPGMLSSGDGDDFATFLGAMAECGYHGAWRILNAQHFGVAQRRRRVFFVGYLGDWRPPAAVLLEPESLRGHPPPRRKAGQNVAPPIAGCSNGGGANGPGRTADDAETLVAFAENSRSEVRLENGDGQTVGAISSGGGKPGQGYPAIAKPLPFDPRQIHHPANYSKPKPGDPSHPLRSVANCEPAIALPSMVRRLTPLECERLQGLPDGHTAITWKDKPAADGPRYRAIGNGMAVPVVRWILDRIAMFEEVAG